MQEMVEMERTKTDLIDLLGVPSVSLILGKRGSGKTAFGYRVLEEADGHDLTPHVMGLPRSKWHLLPDYIEPIEDPSEMSDDSAVLMDESYQYMFAREHGTSFTDDGEASRNRQAEEPALHVRHPSGEEAWTFR